MTVRPAPPRPASSAAAFLALRPSSCCNLGCRHLRRRRRPIPDGPASQPAGINSYFIFTTHNKKSSASFKIFPPRGSRASGASGYTRRLSPARGGASASLARGAVSRPPTGLDFEASQDNSDRDRTLVTPAPPALPARDSDFVMRAPSPFSDSNPSPPILLFIKLPPSSPSSSSLVLSRRRRHDLHGRWAATATAAWSRLAGRPRGAPQSRARPATFSYGIGLRACEPPAGQAVLPSTRARRVAYLAARRRSQAARSAARAARRGRSFGR